MANISASFSDFSSTAASNQPDQADSATVGADLRQLTATLKSVLEPLSTVAGTNTITAACTGLTAYYSGAYEFTPANTNTGATTLNINSIGAKNIFWNGAACVGGELRQNIPVRLVYDGTQFHVISSGFNAPFLDTHPVVQGSADSTKKVRIEADGLTAGQTRTITMPDEDVTLAAATTSARGTVQLATTAEVQTGTDAAKAVTVAALQNGKAVNGTPQLTTSGTAFDFTIPSWAKQVTLTLTDVSLSGTDNLLVQLGDAGGIENTNYVGCAISANNTSILGTTSLSSGFIIGAGGGGASISGAVTLNLHNPATFTWAATGVCGNSAGSVVTWFGGYKATSQAMTTVRLTRTGTDTFDAGGVNVLYT